MSEKKDPPVTYPPSEEGLRFGGDRPRGWIGTYSPPAPYRVFRVIQGGKRDQRRDNAPPDRDLTPLELEWLREEGRRAYETFERLWCEEQQERSES